MRKVIAVAALALLAACGGSDETDLEGPGQDEALTPPATATDSVPSLSPPPVAGTAPVETAGPPMMMDTAPRPVYGAPVRAPGAAAAPAGGAAAAPAPGADTVRP